VEPLGSLSQTRRAMIQDHQSRTAGARMTLILVPIMWSNGYSPPDDYYLIKESQRIGRIPRMNAAMELWCWIPTGPRPSDAKPGGVVHSLDEAEAAVEAAWERARSRTTRDHFDEVGQQVRYGFVGNRGDIRGHRHP